MCFNILESRGIIKNQEIDNLSDDTIQVAEELADMICDHINKMKIVEDDMLYMESEMPAFDESEKLVEVDVNATPEESSTELLSSPSGDLSLLFMSNNSHKIIYLNFFQ